MTVRWGPAGRYKEQNHEPRLSHNCYECVGRVGRDLALRRCRRGGKEPQAERRLQQSQFVGQGWQPAFVALQHRQPTVIARWPFKPIRLAGEQQRQFVAIRIFFPFVFAIQRCIPAVVSRSFKPIRLAVEQPDEFVVALCVFFPLVFAVQCCKPTAVSQ